MDAVAPMPGAVRSFAPPRVASVEGTGLDISVLSDLALKVVYYAGVSTGNDIARALRLPYVKVVEKVLDLLKQHHYLEVRGSATPIAQAFQYVMTERGHRKIEELLRRSTYHGPCPVTLEQYTAAVERQRLRGATVTLAQLQEAFKPLVMPEQILYQLGPAINSGTSIFLFGPPGNGKTTIAEITSTCLGGNVYIPHAIYAEGQFIQIFDEVVHKEAPGADYTGKDERWVCSTRPFVVVGGELTKASLDLVWSEDVKVYQAPLQMKANCGLLLIDDFGRQQITPTELLNRWIIPLARKVDYLHLVTGGTLRIPFQQLVIFATNLEPRQLVDDAFLRRIRYKIMVPPPTLKQIREIFRKVAGEMNIPYSDKAVNLLMSVYYREQGIAPQACHPHDLLEQIVDCARFMGRRVEMDAELMDLACQSYFVKV